MKNEITFSMIKPGAVNRKLVGEIINRFEKKGLNIVGMKLIRVTKTQAAKHYYSHHEKPFYQTLVDYIQSDPVVVFVIEGENAVNLVRLMAGSTNPLEAQLGTIRGDFSADITNNVIHTSDSIENAYREIAIYFKKDELIEVNHLMDKWVFSYEGNLSD